MTQWGWNEVIEAFVAGAFPWVSQFQRLDIHFRPPALDCRSLFNFFGSLFSLAVFAYFVYAPASVFLSWPRWTTLLAAAFCLTIAYMSVFLFLRQKVSQGESHLPIVVNFGLYILIFASLTAGFSRLKLESSHLLVEGYVYGIATGDPVEGALVHLRDIHGAFAESTRTDEDGDFSAYIPKQHSEKIRLITVAAIGYQEEVTSLPAGERLVSFYRIGLVLEEP